MPLNPNIPPDLYDVMGHPVEHSKSPWIHARFAELTGQHLRYGRRLVALDAFAATLQAVVGEGVRGCNVTVPFKFEAFALATQHSQRAALAQAANTLLFSEQAIYADNTDGAGLVADIEGNAGVALAGTRVLLIGAGGAAAGVLGPLLAAQPRSVTVTNRTLSKAQDLVQRHADYAILQKVELKTQDIRGLEANFDIIINATASSLGGAVVPVPASTLKPGALAYDMMYGPAAAPFLSWARAHGAQGMDGLGMLVEQAAESFELWRGVRPPSRQVLAELRQTLAGA